MLFVQRFFMTSPLGVAAGLLSVYTGYKEVYLQIFEMCVLSIARLLRGVGSWTRKPVNQTSWVAVITPTYRPKSVRNRCIIELICGAVCVVTLPF